MRDRVLGKYGFEPFPERLEKQAIKQGSKPAPADTGIKEPNLNSNAAAKQELLLKMADDAKKQAEMDKLIKEREAKKAKEEKDFEEALMKENAEKEAAAQALLNPLPEPSVDAIKAAVAKAEKKL